MASYFDLPPQQKSGAANIEAVPEDQKKHLGRLNLLSPAVTQLLDNWGSEQSDSDSGEGSLSEKEETIPNKLNKKSRSGKAPLDSSTDFQKPAASLLSPKTTQQSTAKGAVQVKSPPTRASASESSKKSGQPHMARFHSLRSMLFFSNIEDKVKKMSHEDSEKEQAAATKWKNQHDRRQMHGQPKSPGNDAAGEEHGIGSRIKTRIRRMTSKEVPTMTTLNEDGGTHDFSDHDSTVSSNTEYKQYQWKPREADEESIDHSDVEDLVRWVSRRDPPSDGEARAAGKAPLFTVTKDDSDHESIGHSDVDDLVQWVSRKSSGPETEQDDRTGYTDASTESDSDMAKEQDSSDEEDADDLVRWISRRDGPTAGPVRGKQQDNSNTGSSKSHLEEESEVSELGHWIKRHDGSSGTSRTVNPTLDTPEEPERGRPLSRDGPSRPKQKGLVTNNNVNELVHEVSRRDSREQSPRTNDEEGKKLLRKEDAKKKKLGMTVDEGSLSHSDVKDPIEEVKSSDLVLQSLEPTVSAFSAVAQTRIPPRPNEAETGDLRQHRGNDPQVSEDRASNYLKASRDTRTQI
jgi:hypothetical protein